MNTAWNRWCQNLPSGTVLSLYDNRITLIIITDIPGRCNVHIQNPYICTTSSERESTDSLITPPIEPHTNLLSNLNIHSTVKANEELGSSKQALGREWSHPYIVGHGSGVQTVRNPWSCDDRKGYSPEDQCFSSIYLPQKITHFAITAPPHKCPTHLSHECPIPISHYVLTSHFMYVWKLSA